MRIYQWLFLHHYASRWRQNGGFCESIIETVTQPIRSETLIESRMKHLSMCCSETLILLWLFFWKPEELVFIDLSYSSLLKSKPHSHLYKFWKSAQLWLTSRIVMHMLLPLLQIRVHCLQIAFKDGFVVCRQVQTNILCLRIQEIPTTAELSRLSVFSKD